MMPTGVEHGKRSFRWLLLLLAGVGLTADLASKYGMFRTLYDGTARAERDVIPGWFKFTTEYYPETPVPAGPFASLRRANAPVMPRVNPGALFGIGGEHKGSANQAFAGISLLAAVGILVWGLRRSTAPDGFLSAALGLILGGTVGNLFDRVVFDGVRDFLYFYKIEWPVFNVADCCLVVGAGMLLLHAFLTPAKAAEAPTTADAVVAG